MTLAEQMRRARTLSEMDLAQLASKAGIGEEEVLGLEAGDVEIRLQSLVKVARALCGEIRFIPDPVTRLIDEITVGDSLEPQLADISRHFELVNGALRVKGTSLSLGHLLSALGEGLSLREVAAGAGIPRTVIREALRELAGKF